MLNHSKARSRAGLTKFSFAVLGTLLRILPWLLVIAPAAALFLLIREYCVNIPFLDDWMFVHMFEKEKAGTLALHDFFVVQMEHRMAFVRAFILFFHKLWPTDYTKQMFFSWVLFVLTYTNVAILMKRTAGGLFRSWWPVLALTGLVIFSPVQYRIVLWAMMFQVACPAFFLSMALVALTGGSSLWLRWVVGVVCASCATQSFASGILVWLLALPVIVWGGAIPERKSRVWFTALWLTAFGVTMALYLTNLKNEVDPAFAYKLGNEATLRHDVSGFVLDPGRSVRFVLRFLGSHLARGTSFAVMDASLFFGVVSAGLFLGAAGFCVVHWKREDLRARLLPWLAFGTYSIGTGALVAIGRMWASRNGDNAISPRYVIHAVPLTVALVVLVWIIAGDWIHRHKDSHGLAARLMQGAAIFFLCVQILSWANGVRLMEMWESSRLRGAVSVRFFKTACQSEEVVPANRDLARRADNLGLLDPPMLTNTRLENFRRSPKMLNTNTARFRSLDIEVDGESYYGVARGFSCLSSRERVADGVFLAYRLPKQGRWEIFHVAQVTGMPLTLLDTLAKDAQFIHTPSTHIGQEGLSGFASRFSIDRLPKGVHYIMAWACDARRQTVHPMAGFFQLDTRGPRPSLKKLGSDPTSVGLGKSLGAGKSAP